MNPAARVECDLACADCGYNLRKQPLPGRCPECGGDVGRSIERAASTARVNSILTPALERITWALFVAGVVLTLLTGGFVIACRYAGVTARDLEYDSTPLAERFSFYHKCLSFVPVLALPGFPICLAVGILCEFRKQFWGSMRAWGAALLTVTYAVLWAWMMF